MSGQVSMFDVMFPDFKIDKPIRLIELFAGVGSQAMALRNIGANFEHYKIAEWEVSAFKSYKAIHMPNDDTDYSQGISKGELTQILFDYGISTNGKDPMTIKEIQRKNEKWLRETYNNIKATNNLCSICNFKGEDLEIVDIDSFTYLLTYSFPCQDLSVAGKMKGMAKGSGTRSGLLWEVERLLNEVENLPQVLLMENVPQVISDANIKDFQLWQKFLEEKGYSNYTEILNAKDYGVAQNRERCFMVSILGEWNYKFPQPIPLTKTMKDYLEDEVDEKYYINNEKAQKLIQQLIESGQLNKKRECVDGSINNPKIKDVSNCIKARYDAGISNQRSEGIVVIESNEKSVVGGIYTDVSERFQRGILKDLSRALKANCHDSGVVEILQPKVIMTELQPREDGVSNTLTTVQKDNLVLEPKLVGGLGEKDWGKQWRQGNRVYDADAIAMALNASPVGNTGGYSYLYKTDYRIRKLTPLECWRLMAFTDEDFHKAEEVNSNTQLYKQAGNSIVVKVLEAIFKQML